MSLSGLERFTQAFKERLSLPMGASNQLLGVDAQRRFTSHPLVKEVPIVTNADELAQQQGSGESFARVFNSWQRVSRRGRGNWSNRAMPEELDTWEFDETQNRLRCTYNTNSVVGFISPESSDHYDFEVILSSDNADDDVIGLVIAFARDNQGRDHSLIAARVFNDTDQTFRVIRDYAPNYTVVDQGHPDLVHLNGKTFPQQDTEYSNGSWGGWSDHPDGVLLKVIRRGDDITVRTSQPSSDTYFEPATMSVNLNDDPDLAVFKGPQRFGYMCQSQAGSTWTIIQRPQTRQFIVDLSGWSDTVEPNDNVKLWELENGQWQSRDATLQQLVSQDIISRGCLHLNATTGRYFMVDKGRKLFMDTIFQ